MLETLSTRICEVSISELAELIEKDATVFTRVIQVANTVAHNPGMAPLATLDHAIHQIGFSRVRSLALSLLLLENTGAGNSAEQREAAAHALCAALLAQGAAEGHGYVDPEIAFACAALRNLGRILLPVVSLEHYRDAYHRAQHGPESAAFRALFSLSPIELSQELLSATHLPDDVKFTLRECGVGHFTAESAQPSTRLLATADFGTRLAAHVLARQESAEDFLRSSAALAREYHRPLPGLVELLPAALGYADERLSCFLRCDGVASLPTPSLKRVHLRWRQLTVEPSSAISPPTRHPPTANDAVEFPSPSPEVELPHTPAPHTPAPAPLSADEAWQAALAEIREAFGSDLCWVFGTRPRGKLLHLLHGIGPNWRHFQHAATIRSDERTIFGMCLARREAIVIHNLHDRKLASHLPPWLLDGAGAPHSFVLLHLDQAGHPPLLVLIGWKSAHPLQIKRAQLDVVHRVLESTTTRHPFAA